MKIIPTPGCVVLYFPSEADRLEGMEVHSEAPCAALVAFVVSPISVNLMVCDHDGVTWTRRAVPINVEAPAGQVWTVGHAEWMDYQKGQAAKTEKAEAALSAARAS